MSYRFESGGTVEITMRGDISMPEALDVADRLIALKREEIAAAARAQEGQSRE